MIDEKTKFLMLALILVLSPCLAAATDYTISPTGATNDQKIINEAIDAASKSGEGTVYLNEGVYEITGPIIIKSNIVLTGSSNAIVRVSSSSSQWFTGSTGIISCRESLKNVEIYSFQIDGNCDELPRNFANTDGHAHDCERLILIGGSSTNFGNNIKIHDMKLYDAFSDGIHIRFSENILIYNNEISNVQHEGFYLVNCRNSEISGNSIAGITSDCGRLDNCEFVLVENNLFFSYDGTHNNGAWKGGENGLQVGDSGSSKGWNIKNSVRTISTNNITITKNKFVNNGLKAILLDAAGVSKSKNVYIDENEFIGVEAIKNVGIPVTDVIRGDSSTGNTSIGVVDNVSYDNPPTLEMSETIFSSIFDVLDISFFETGRIEQTADSIPYTVQQTEQGAIMGGIKIIGFQDLINIGNVSYIPDEKSIFVKYAVVKAPSFDLWNMGVSDIKTNIETKIENGTAYAVLTVKMECYKISTSKLTGKTKKNTHISTATFKDSYPAPEILRRPTDAQGIITYYNNSVNPHTLIYVPSEGLTKISYGYEGNYSEHTLMTGERGKNENGVQITNFSTCDYWRGSIPHQGNALFLSGSIDQSKLNITCFTPYESFKVTKFEYTEKTWNGQSFSDWVLPFVLKLGVILFFLIRILRIPFS